VLAGRPAEPDLAFLAVAVGHDAVDEDAGVAHQIGRLERAEHHRQPQVAVEDERLHRAEARRHTAVFPTGAIRAQL